MHTSYGLATILFLSPLRMSFRIRSVLAAGEREVHLQLQLGTRDEGSESDSEKERDLSFGRSEVHETQSSVVVVRDSWARRKWGWGVKA